MISVFKFIAVPIMLEINNSHG